MYSFYIAHHKEQNTVKTNFHEHVQVDTIISHNGMNKVFNIKDLVI